MCKVYEQTYGKMSEDVLELYNLLDKCNALNSECTEEYLISLMERILHENIITLFTVQSGYTVRCINLSDVENYEDLCVRTYCGTLGLEIMETHSTLACKGVPFKDMTISNLAQFLATGELRVDLKPYDYVYGIYDDNGEFIESIYGNSLKDIVGYFKNLGLEICDKIAQSSDWDKINVHDDADTFKSFYIKKIRIHDGEVLSIA